MQISQCITQIKLILSTIYSIDQPNKEQFRFFFLVALLKQIVNIKHIEESNKNHFHYILKIIWHFTNNRKSFTNIGIYN